MPINCTSNFFFLPLGGAGEIGMNLNLYGYGKPNQEKWIMVDLGITFSKGEPPGSDVVMPDPSYIEEKRDDLEGLILTHAHEDHLGAVPYLWPRLKCPIYATPFTASILKEKLIKAGLDTKAEIRIIKTNSKFDIHPFKLELIALTHSIPEATAVVIRTPTDTVLHTGDWKFDPKPVCGSKVNRKALKALGNEKILAIICDSTNVFNSGSSGSEFDLLKPLSEEIAKYSGLVAISCFASNVARLETISMAAKINGRSVLLLGRSLKRIEKVARENGFLKKLPHFLSEKEAKNTPNNKILIICTGSQGEPRAALNKLATNQHPNFKLKAGDLVIFSSKVIPGNEVAVNELLNQLSNINVTILTSKDLHVHVSGHPSRDELKTMYELIKPTFSIPVHGEVRHLIEHARLALTYNCEQAVVARNGNMINLAKNPPKVVDTVTNGRLSLEGLRLIPVNSEIHRSRKQAMWHGTATITIAINKFNKEILSDQITTTGLFDSEDDIDLVSARKIARAAGKNFLEQGIINDKELAELIRVAIRHFFKVKLGKKPITMVHLVEVGH